jgi:DNA topoisomerase-1
VGAHPESGEPVTSSIGRYGPYLAHAGKYARLQSTAEVFETGMNAAVVKLAEAANGAGRQRGGASREPLKVLGAHPRTEAEIKLMDGRYGVYVTDGTTNATLPKSIAPNELTLEEAAQLIDARAAMPSKGKKKAAPKKKATPKKKKAPAKAKAKT